MYRMKWLTIKKKEKKKRKKNYESEQHELQQ